MKVKAYIAAGTALKEAGTSTDGCSFVGWLLDDKYEPACWSHDFARRNLIPEITSQSKNDNMFRNALRHLGMSDWRSNLMYYFTRSQGFMSEKVNMSGNAFVGFIFFLTVFAVMFYFGAIKGG